MSGGGGGGKTTSTVQQNADPWSGVQPYLKQAYGDAANLFTSQAPQLYPGQFTATPDYLYQQGQAQGLGAATNQLPHLAGLMQGGAAQLAGASPYTSMAMPGVSQLYAAGDPARNPFFQSALESAQRPVIQQFQEQIMPGIRTGAQGAGQLGGTRQGIAEGIAARGATQSLADMAAQMGSQAYGQGLQATGAAAGLGLSAEQQAAEAQARGLALAPQVAQMQLLPGQVMQDIGAQRTAAQQAQINEAMQRYQYGQELPFSQMERYLSLLAGAPGGSSSSTSIGPATGGSNPLMSGVGGALTGYSAGTALGGALGGAASGMSLGPWGAVAGGLLGLMM